MQLLLQMKIGVTVLVIVQVKVVKSLFGLFVKIKIDGENHLRNNDAHKGVRISKQDIIMPKTCEKFCKKRLKAGNILCQRENLNSLN